MITARFAVAIALATFVASCGGAATDAKALTDEGYAALGSGKGAEALSSFEEALKVLEPSDPQYARAKLGACQALVGVNANSAATDFTEFCAENPGVAQFSDMQSLLTEMTKAGEFPAGIEVLKYAKEAFPERHADLDKLAAEMSKKAEASGDTSLQDTLRGMGYLGK